MPDTLGSASICCGQFSQTTFGFAGGYFSNSSTYVLGTYQGAAFTDTAAVQVAIIR
jgi:hypothetical protein